MTPVIQVWSLPLGSKKDAEAQNLKSAAPMISWKTGCPKKWKNSRAESWFSHPGRGAPVHIPNFFHFFLASNYSLIAIMSVLDDTIYKLNFVKLLKKLFFFKFKQLCYGLDSLHTYWAYLGQCSNLTLIVQCEH